HSLSSGFCRYCAAYLHQTITRDCGVCGTKTLFGSRDLWRPVNVRLDLEKDVLFFEGREHVRRQIYGVKALHHDYHHALLLVIVPAGDRRRDMLQPKARIFAGGFSLVLCGSSGLSNPSSTNGYGRQLIARRWTSAYPSACRLYHSIPRATIQA